MQIDLSKLAGKLFKDTCTMKEPACTGKVDADADLSGVPDATCTENSPDLDGVDIGYIQLSKDCRACSVRRRRKRLICVLIMVVSLIICVTLPLLLVRLFSNSADGNCGTVPTEMSADSICVSCRLAQSDKFSARISWKQPYLNLDLCCTINSEPLYRLSQIMSLQASTSAANENSARERPAAHLTLNITALNDDKQSLLWMVDDGIGTAFLSGGTQYVNNSIRVPEDGTYFLYSFITFTSAGFDRAAMLNHYVYRKSCHTHHAGPQLLMMNKQTRNNGDLVYQTSSLSKVVRLQADDRIFTAVSDIDAIYSAMFSNYMGLYKL